MISSLPSPTPRYLTTPTQFGTKPKQHSDEPIQPLDEDTPDHGHQTLTLPDERTKACDDRGIPWAHVPLDCDTSGNITRTKNNVIYKIPAIATCFSAPELNQANEQAVLMSLHNALNAQGNYQTAFFRLPNVTKFIEKHFDRLTTLLSAKMGILLKRDGESFRLEQAPRSTGRVLDEIDNLIRASDAGEALPSEIVGLVIDNVGDVFNKDCFELNIQMFCEKRNVAWKNAFVNDALSDDSKFSYLLNLLREVERRKLPLDLSQLERLRELLNRITLKECLRINLSNANLCDKDLQGLYFSDGMMTNAKLDRANLKDANLSYVDFNSTSLTGANLSGANLTRAYFAWTNLTNANLCKANLTGVNLRDRDLTSVNLAGVTLGDTDLCGANLYANDLTGLDIRGRVNFYYANLSRANLSGVNFKGKVDLRYADLRGADLRGANLKGIDLRGADLTGALLQNANLEGARLDGCTLIEASLRGANLRRANLSEVQLELTQLAGDVYDEQTQTYKMGMPELEGTIFCGATLTATEHIQVDHSRLLARSNLVGAKLTNINLKNAGTDINLKGATLTNVSLPGTIRNWDFRDAIFQSMSFAGTSKDRPTQILSCDFQRAKLNDTSFENAILADTNFSLISDLSRCKFTNAKLTKVDVTGTNFSGVDLTNGSSMEDVNITDASRTMGMRYSQEAISALPSTSRWYLALTNLFTRHSQP